MILVPRRQVWTQQPQGAVAIDWTNPLTKGLELCANPANGMREQITGAMFSTFGTAPIISKNPRGLAYDSRNAFGGLILPQAKSVATDASTQFVLMDYEAKAGSWSGLFCISSASGSTAYAGIQDCGSATFGFYPTPVPWWDSTVPSSNFGIQSVALAGDAANSRIYKNGAELSQVASALSPQATSRVVLFGERAAYATYAVKGRIYLYLAWSRRLSPGEIQRLHDNPWQIFKRQDSRIWVPVSAGSGSIVTTITGGATASAAGAQLNVSMLAGVGSASAQGVAATLSCAIQTTTGAATAQGVAAALNASIQTTAAGVFAQGVASNILHGVTVQAAAGNATAQGAAANLNSVIQTTTVSAFAQGVSASLSGALTISTVAGNATAVGQASLLNTSIVCSVGNASAAIATALIESGASILTTAGGVSAQGIVAAINTSIATIPAGAVAQGVTGGISTPFSTLVYCFTGQGEAVGVPAIVFPGVLVLERVEVMSRLLVTSEQKSRLNQIIFKGSCIH